MPDRPTLRQILLLCFLGPVCLSAREGTITTRDGHSYSGQIRLGSNTVVVADLKNNAIRQLPLTNLLGLRLLTPPPPEERTGPNRRGQLAGPLTWLQANVGPTTRPGRATTQAGRVRLWSGGTDLAGSSDAFQFAYTELVGDGEIAGHLLRLSYPGTTTQAGLMMRNSLQADSKNVFLAVSPQGAIFQSRQRTGFPPTPRPVNLSSPWLRLQRDGDWFRAYTSLDGRSWRLASEIQTVMGPKLLVGCALTGRNPIHPSRAQTERLTAALFDQVRTGHALRHHAFLPKVHLQSGSVLAEDIAFAKDFDIHLAGTTPWPAIAFSQASQIRFQWIPTYWSDKIQAGRPGVLLASGEFLEGDLKEIKAGMCLMSTVLFGLRKFDAHHEILSVVLRPQRRLATPPVSCEIRTWSGSVMRGHLHSLTQQGVLLQEPLLGRLPIPFHVVKEITWHRPV